MSELHEKFGKLLHAERNRRGISIADLSAELKISEGNLEAIESGQNDELPSELYYNLFAKSYAEYLGIDFNATMEAIKEDIGEAEFTGSEEDEVTQPGTSPAVTRPDEEAEEEEASGGHGKLLWTLAISVVVVFALVVVGYKLFLEDSSSAGGSGDADSPDGSSELSEEQEAINAAYAAYDWSGVEAPTYDSLLLSLTAREESWATVLADGDTVLYQNLTEWREYTIKARYRLLVSVGVPRVVDIKLNGQEAYLASPSSGRISRVEINQVNAERFLEPPEPKIVRQSASPSQGAAQPVAEPQPVEVTPTDDASGSPTPIEDNGQTDDTEAGNVSPTSSGSTDQADDATGPESGAVDIGRQTTETGGPRGGFTRNDHSRDRSSATSMTAQEEPAASDSL
ncbi:DUF4115 domain-containing protein [candidate division GN15 bacterium]|nr:DUF4115 domain-containing protein [candidate division GN15 bacterium]